MTKPFKYLVRGLIVNAGILFIASIYLVVTIRLNYNGQCGVFWFFGCEAKLFLLEVHILYRQVPVCKQYLEPPLLLPLECFPVWIELLENLFLA